MNRVFSALILPSPLLGPPFYDPLAAALAATTDWVVAVADLPHDPSESREVLTEFENAIADTTDLLIAHSNAGYYLPALTQDRDVSIIAMDAALPTGDGADTMLAPPGAMDFLSDLPQDDGRLPPWPAWWSRADIEPLFPTQDWYERAVATAPRLPTSYFTGRLPVPDGWAAGRRGYLALGQKYDAERAWATNSGWCVRQIPGGHLEHLTNPDLIAAELNALAAELDPLARS